jgi:hypothetical protein
MRKPTCRQPIDLLPGTNPLEVIHFSVIDAQTPQNRPCRPRSDPAAAVRGSRLADPCAPRTKRMALLPVGGLARFVRPRAAALSVGPDRQRRPPSARSASRSRSRDQCTLRGRNGVAAFRIAVRDQGQQEADQSPAGPCATVGMTLPDERAAFLRAAEQTDGQARTLCMTLAYASRKTPDCHRQYGAPRWLRSMEQEIKEVMRHHHPVRSVRMTASS